MSDISQMCNAGDLLFVVYTVLGMHKKSHGGCLRATRGALGCGFELFKIGNGHISEPTWLLMPGGRTAPHTDFRWKFQASVHLKTVCPVSKTAAERQLCLLTWAIR